MSHQQNAFLHRMGLPFSPTDAEEQRYFQTSTPLYDIAEVLESQLKLEFHLLKKFLKSIERKEHN